MKATPAEWEILQVLWERGPQAVRDDSTRAHIFAPAMAREPMQGSFLEDVLRRVFGGSVAALRQGAPA